MIINSVQDFRSPPSRIVSLVPSQTELLWYLGLENETVGITKFCVHPKEWLTKKAIIGGTKNVHITAVRNLGPDLIIANKEENIKEQVEELAANYPVWVTDVNNLREALGMITAVGSLTNRTDRAVQLAKELDQSFSQIERLNPTLNTAYLVWRNPLMTVGGDTFIHDMLISCGFNNIFASQTRYPEITVEDLKRLDCKLLLLSTEPYPFNKHHMAELQALLPLTKIMLVDGELFSWYGSRLLQSPSYFTRLIAEIKTKKL